MTENQTDREVDPDDRTGPVWGTTSFVPGPEVGLVSRHTIGLVEHDNPSTRERLWDLVAQDAPLDDILDELSSTGLKALPDFGLAQVEGERVRVVARGRTVITAELSSGSTHEIDASDVRTWIEEVVGDVVELTMSLPNDDDSPPSEDFAVLAGSVPASSLVRRFDEADQHADLAEDGWSADQPMDDLAEPAPTRHDAAEAESGSDAAPEEDPSLDVDGAVDADPAAADPAAADPAVDADESEMVRDSDPAFTSPSNETGTWFDDIEAEIDDQSAQPHPTVPQPPADSQPADPQPPAPVVDPPTGSGGWSESASDASLGSTSSLFAAPSAGFDGPEAADPSPSGEPAVAGVLAFSNGDRVVVDHRVLIGRNPKSADPIEGEPARIVKFDGPGQGLSRTHAEVRIEEGELVLEDLHSTNGTEVLLPGQQRHRLRGGEPIVVVPGTLIDFGDELNCTVETP